MSDRLTVVFDDPDLYRRVKVRAAEEGVAVKALIERSLRQLLGEDADILGSEEAKTWDWDAFDRWQAEAARLDAELGMDYPRDLSDVKKHLYGEVARPAARELMFAEERAPYNAE